MGSFIQADGEIPILLWRILNPVQLKSSPEDLLQSSVGPGIPRRRGIGLWDQSGTFLCLFISQFIPCDASMTGDPVDIDLSRLNGLTSWGPGGPGVCNLLEGQDGVLTGASGGAL